MPEADVRALLGCGTKTGVAKALETLQRVGLLCTNDSNRKLRRTLQDASVKHGRSETPCGTVIQRVDLGMTMGLLQPPRLSSIHQYSQQCFRRSHEVVHRAWETIDDDLIHGRVVSRESVSTRKGKEAPGRLLVYPGMARLDPQKVSHVANVRRYSFSDGRQDAWRH